MVAKYITDSEDVRIIGGKLVLVRKGIAFCKLQIFSAASKFRTAVSGSTYEYSLNVEEIADGNEDEDAGEDPGEDVDDKNENSVFSEDDSVDTNTAMSDDIKVPGESIPQSDLFLWKFPAEVSQSTLDGRNGSSACSVIAFIFAHGVWHQHLDLQPSPLLSPLLVKLLCAAIRAGNRHYDRCRQSLPQHFLSASEATTITQPCVSVSVESPLPVRVFDEHSPTTLLSQLRRLCAGDQGDAAVLIANEKTVLFVSVGTTSIVLVDTHRHGLHGAQVLLGQPRNLNQFVCVCQTVLDLQDDTYANLCFIGF